MANMMKIRIKRQTKAGGQVRAVGEEIDVSDADARYLIGCKKAEPVDPKPAKAGPMFKNK